MAFSLFCESSKLCHHKEGEGGEVRHHFALGAFVRRSSTCALSILPVPPLKGQGEVQVGDASGPCSQPEGSPKTILLSTSGFLHPSCCWQKNKIIKKKDRSVNLELLLWMNVNC